MDLLGHLHDEHEQLDSQVAQLERCLKPRSACRPADADAALGQLLKSIPNHIEFEHEHFYAPLRESGQAKDELIEALIGEHEELLKILAELKQLRRREVPVGHEVFRAHGRRFVKLYREHTQREHRSLFPLLEQLPPQTAGPHRGPAAPAHRHADPELVSKDMTLNALIRRFPEVRPVLQALQINCRWFGSETVEETAWYHGMQAEDLLQRLSQAILARHH